MANYKEVNSEGSSYVRCHAIVIKNDLNSRPFAEFHEESIVSFGGAQFSQPADGCRLPVTPDEAIAVLDVATNLPTGEVITHARLYQLLYSAYIQTATERDAE